MGGGTCSATRDPPPRSAWPALRAALRAHDGLIDGSAALLSAAADLLGAPEGWPRLVMTTADAPERLAAVAPLVTAAAATDPVAHALCVQAGTDLAVSLLRAADGLTDPLLAATGGLLAAAPVAEALDASPGRGRRRALPRPRAEPSTGPCTSPGTCATREASPSTRHTSSLR